VSASKQLACHESARVSNCSSSVSPASGPNERDDKKQRPVAADVQQQQITKGTVPVVHVVPRFLFGHCFCNTRGDTLFCLQLPSKRWRVISNGADTTPRQHWGLSKSLEHDCSIVFGHLKHCFCHTPIDAALYCLQLPSKRWLPSLIGADTKP
jgi:hypothetical protein